MHACPHGFVEEPGGGGGGGHMPTVSARGKRVASPGSWERLGTGRYEEIE